MTLHVDHSGLLKDLNHPDIYLYKKYIKSPYLTNIKFHHKFRCCFRILYDSFQILLDETSNSTYLYRWKPAYIIEQPILVPIGLLFIGTLCYYFWRSTSQLFHTFIKFVRYMLYPRYKKYPKNTKEEDTNAWI